MWLYCYTNLCCLQYEHMILIKTLKTRAYFLPVRIRVYLINLEGQIYGHTVIKPILLAVRRYELDQECKTERFIQLDFGAQKFSILPANPFTCLAFQFFQMVPTFEAHNTLISVSGSTVA